MLTDVVPDPHAHAPVRFVCPDCGAAIYVDEGMRAVLLDSGCVECNASVSPSDFERLD